MEEEFIPKVKADLFEGFKPKTAFFLGLVGGFLVLATIGFFVMLSINLSSGSIDKNKQPGVTTDQDQTDPTKPEINYEALGRVTNDDHVRGNEKAKVTLVEYSDFECPVCSNFKPELDKILAEYKDEVKLVYRHFPLTSIHPYAQKAAVASECAAEQDKFWEMHDKLFTEQRNITAILKLSDKKEVPGKLIVEAINTQTGETINVDITEAVGQIKQLAQTVGVDSKKFNACLDSDKYLTKVNQNAEEFTNIVTDPRSQGTPSLFINDQDSVLGYVPASSLKQKIDRVLGK